MIYFFKRARSLVISGFYSLLFLAPVSAQTTFYNKSLPCSASSKALGLKTELLSEDQALLRWIEVPQTAEYHLQIRHAGAGGTLLLDTFLATTTFSVGALPDGELLSWSVQAQCMQGELSAWASQDTFVLPKQDWACGDLFVDMRDGEFYRTVQMGDQCWFQQNLNYDLGPGTFGFSTGLDCNNPSKAGRFYNWTAAKIIDPMYVDSFYWIEGEQGVCPDGWRFPTIADFDVLLSDTSINFETIQIGGGSGFEAHLAGYMNTWDNFTQVEKTAFFISSTQSPYSDRRMMVIGLDGRYSFAIERGQITKLCRGSIRCLKE